MPLSFKAFYHYPTIASRSFFRRAVRHGKWLQMAANGFFKPLKDNVSSALIEVTRTSGKIAAEDLAFQRSSNPAITPLLDKQSQRLLHLVRNLTQVSTAGTDVKPSSISDVDSLEDKWHGLVDIFDNLLEKADACLDEYTGVIKRGSLPQQTNDSVPTRKAHPPQSYRPQNLPKPQLLFEHPPKNHETTPFKPLLHSKPHSIQPLEESVEDERKQYAHPYQAEIESLRYPAFVHQNDTPIPFLPLESTTATFVDTPEAVTLMLQDLKSANEIAVDLEHHDTHSYLGLTSLMQISTRHKDWIVDTLKPWREDLQVLNEVFADPNILKVFHGAFMDMIWLQRDLGLYVVGLFDTFHASKTLGYPKNSLAALLARHANFDAAKQYQMADWRLRPLPETMFEYARSDTHFLLYIYDNLRNELLEKSDFSIPDGDLIEIVLRKSKEESLQRYERPIYDAQHGSGSSGWYNLLSSTPAILTQEQFAVFRAVHQWRDTIARQEDESVNIIMPKHVMFNIAREMPVEMAPLLGCSQPVTVFVRSRAPQLLDVIKKAKTDGATGPDLMDLLRATDPSKSKIVESTAPLAGTTSTVVNVKTLPPAPRTENPTSLQLSSSTFWGPTLERNSDGNKPRHFSTSTDNICLALPLPQLTAEVFMGSDATRSTVVQDVDEDPGARAQHAYVKNRKPKEESEVFIVKNVAGPRKRKASDLEESLDHPEPVPLGEVQATATTSGVENEKQQRVSQKSEGKTARRAERRAQKRMEKQQRKLEEQKDTHKAAEETAFDYSSAPSVLHNKEAHRPRPGDEKAFNPYVKSLDTPKGVKHFKKETPGKSFTFQS
ncbi:MAG: hypothetical protein Q9195_000377 [Heterodermia aff. obscurata]